LQSKAKVFPKVKKKSLKNQRKSCAPQCKPKQDKKRLTKLVVTKKWQANIQRREKRGRINKIFLHAHQFNHDT